MWCCKCNNNLSKCTCDDLEERLTSINPGSFMYKKCKLCGKHYEKCKCENPVWTTNSDNKEIDKELNAENN